MTNSGNTTAAIVALLLSSACAVSPPPAASSTGAPGSTVEASQRVYVMRHLWKGEGGDPDLTPRGMEAAAGLAEQLKDSRIKAVFVTATRRAQQTGAPLAAKLGMAVTTYDPRDPAGLALAVSQVRGDVLVVGHSNTVPILVAQFGGTPPPPLGENDYGAIYRVDVASKAVQTFDIDKPGPALAE